MKIRKSCKDIWNAFMVEDAIFSINDIPYCPTTIKSLPIEIITWNEAITIYNKHIKRNDENFYSDVFVCWYIDDYKFDGSAGIWNKYEYVLKILKHFAGAITPDFSTYQDFPDPLKRYNTYRMRAYGYWLAKNGIQIINNVRWGSWESYCYCYDGLPKNSILAIGTVGGSPKKLIDRERFNSGFFEMIARTKPHTIIVYGSTNYPCFIEAKKQGIEIIGYQSHTAKAFANKRIDHE